MLVSYDLKKLITEFNFLLQGHQNVGELRLRRNEIEVNTIILQGHQNVGELRQVMMNFRTILDIAGSPECW